MSAGISIARKPWRAALWPVLAALLVVPLVAMQFTDEVRWDLADFVAAALLLGALGVAIEAICRIPASTTARLAASALAVVAFLLVWAELAVGIF